MPQRTYSWTTPDPDRRPLNDRSGLEYFRALINGELPPQPISETIGWRVVHADEGLLRVSLLPQEHHLHGGGVVHGGVLATLLDSVMAGAVMTRLRQGQACTTVQMGMNNIRRVKPGEGEIVAEGRVTSLSRRTATAQAVIRNAGGELVAEGSTTCLIL